MNKRFDSPRTISRVAPKQSATAAVYRHRQQIAYGVITNVSVTGACIVTDNSLLAGSDVELKLSFYQEPRLFDLPARVVWNRLGGVADEGVAGMQLHGVRFTKVSALQRSELHSVLVTENFENIFKPMTSEFELLKSSLASELEEVATQIQRTTGQET